MDPERLKARFPDLTDEDLEAYATVTRRVLRDPGARAKALLEVMALARAALAKQAGASPLTRDEALALDYLRAVEKMQGPTGSPH